MSGQAKIQKRYDSLYNDVKTFFLNSTSGKVTVGSVATLTRYGMEVVQTTKGWKEMRGSDKKDLVLGVITAVVQDLLEDPKVVGKHFDEDTKEAILAALDIAPMIIDAAVGFAKTYAGNQAQGGARPKLCC